MYLAPGHKKVPHPWFTLTAKLQLARRNQSNGMSLIQTQKQLTLMFISESGSSSTASLSLSDIVGRFKNGGFVIENTIVDNFTKQRFYQNSNMANYVNNAPSALHDISRTIQN